MRKIFLALVAIVMAFQVHAFTPALKADRLRCEYLTDPLGIDAAHPRLSWVIEAKERGTMQSAYQILVASSEAKLNKNQGDLWDSGKVESDKSIQIAYAGAPLQSRQQCFWKLRVWDEMGKASDYSQPASWEMGLLSPSDWNGQWIAHTTDTNCAPAPLLRREFSVTKKIKQARAYICGLAYYELRINGRKIGNHILDPGYTRFDRRALYVTYDVTGALSRGKNAVGVILGNGWYNVQSLAVWYFDKAPWRSAPKLRMDLVIDYTDGTSETIATDEQWKTSVGPIVFNSIYGGETYDARQEKPGWDLPGYKAADWTAALVVKAPTDKLAAQAMPPIRIDETIKPVKLTQPKPGVYVYDLGQNMAGFAQLNISGPAGTQVTIKYGERIDKDGMLDRAAIAQHMIKTNSPQQFQTDTYILKGKGRESWHARFVYHGFQYVEVTGAPGPLTLDNLTGYFVHSAVRPVGEFECSNPLFNRITKCARYSYLSNLQSIPTDCPHREKNGWTGDAHLACEQGLFNYDSAPVYTKWINDLDDEQKPTGELPGIVPTSGWGYHWGNGPAWDSAFLLIPYYMYEYCGDTRILESHYAGFKRYVDYLTSKSKDDIVSIGLNDWAPAKTETPADITSTAYYYRDTLITAKTAALLGRKEEAQKYSDLAENIKEAFNKKFFNAEKASYGNGSQTSLSCALYQDLADKDVRARVMTNLVANIEKHDNHIDTGILGAKYLLSALTDMGRADVAYRIASQKTQPSWGWWLEQGATTLWEQWDGGASRNHIMYGDIVAWFYKSLAGINPDPAAPGFKHFYIKPQIVGDLTYAKASYDSIHGRIASEWTLANGRLVLNVEVPANTTATVYIPVADSEKILEGKRPAYVASGVKSIWTNKGVTMIEVGSGKYRFSAPF